MATLRPISTPHRETRGLHANRSRIPWKDWISWIALIMLAAEVAVLTLYYPVSKAGDGNAFGLVVIGTIALLDAAAQWFWMRSRMHISIWWIPANILGWYIAAGFSYIDFFPAVARLASLRGDLLHVVCWCLAAIFLSLPQWLLLRRRYRRAWAWMVARPFAWLAGFGLIALEDYFQFVRFGFFHPDSILRWPVPELVGWSAFFAVFSFGFAVVSGAALVWIRQRPIDSQSNRAA